MQHTNVRDPRLGWCESDSIPLSSGKKERDSVRASRISRMKMTTVATSISAMFRSLCGRGRKRGAGETLGLDTRT